MEFTELRLCEKAGKVLSYCGQASNASPVTIAYQWLISDTFWHYIDWDVSVFSQAKSYIARLFLKEKSGALAGTGDSYYDGDALYWFGYLTTYWCFEYGVAGRDIAKTYDVQKILDGYEMYHTLSVKHAIGKIKEDCRL